MINTKDSKPDRDTTEVSLDGLKLVNRLINLLGWIIIPSVLLMIATSIILIVQSLSTGYGSQSGLILDSLLDLARLLWSSIAPIILIIVLGMLLRWTLFSAQGNRFSLRIMSVLSNVTSLIAVLVVATICLLPILKIGTPEALGNIALVIIGFYFGSERKLRQGAEEDNEEDNNQKEQAKPRTKQVKN